MDKKEELMNTLVFHPEERERYKAAVGLSEFKDEIVVNCLVKRLEEEKSKLVQEGITSSLIRINTEIVANTCIELLRSENAHLRNTALEILQVLDSISLPATKKLLDDPDPDVRLFAVNVLGETKSREGIEALRQVVEKDNDVNIVAAAIEYIGEMGSRSEDREAVKKALQRFSEPFLEYAAEMALKKMGAN